MKNTRGSVIRKPGSSRLYVQFRYLGRRVEKSSGLSDTPENREILRNWLNSSFQKIGSGAFRFSEAFPGASEVEKKRYSLLEGREYKPEPHEILFVQFCDEWLEKVLSTIPSANKRRDYKSSIISRVRPYFGDFTFAEITRDELGLFISQLTHDKGPRAGKPLSKKRINNIFIPFRKIWESARNKNHWDLRCPFENLEEFFPPEKEFSFEEYEEMVNVFRFDEWMMILDNIDPHHRPIVEIMIMTGLSASELSGFRRKDFRGDELWIRNSIVRDVEKSQLKNKYRIRKIPVTAAIHKNMKILLDRTDNNYPFLTVTGLSFREGTFRKNYWIPALNKAKIPYKKPYCTRHTYAAWALAIGIDFNRLVSLMGHGSKKMIYEVYGNYVEGLEKDKKKIRAYFGNDFIGL